MTLARMVKNVSLLSSDNSTDTTQMFGPDGNKPRTDSLKSVTQLKLLLIQEKMECHFISKI